LFASPRAFSLQSLRHLIGLKSAIAEENKVRIGKKARIFTNFYKRRTQMKV